MPARLILNADDFGLTPGVNRAIAELYAAGALTSATLMARGAAFADAVATAHVYSGLGTGCHIVFTDGTPVSPPETIPSLLGPDRQAFRPSLRAFLLAAVAGRIHREELKREAVAQIRTLQSAGLHVTHLDTHKHTHILPQIAGPLLEAAVETGVPAIRNPFEAPWSLRLGHTRLLRLLSVAGSRLLRRSFLAQPAIRSGAVRSTDGTLGISATGRLNEPTLRRILLALPDSGTWELVCHPGYNDRDLDAITTRLRDTRNIERTALLTIFSTENSQTENSQLSHSSPIPHNSPAQSPSLSNTPHNIPNRPPPELIHYGRL